MPIYEFICGGCEADFEKLVPSAEAAASAVCPECGSKQVHKKPSLFGVAAKSSSAASAPSFSGSSGGGGCCGGACSCH